MHRSRTSVAIQHRACAACPRLAQVAGEHTSPLCIARDRHANALCTSLTCRLRATPHILRATRRILRAMLLILHTTSPNLRATRRILRARSPNLRATRRILHATSLNLRATQHPFARCHTTAAQPGASSAQPPTPSASRPISSPTSQSQRPTPSPDRITTASQELHWTPRKHIATLSRPPTRRGPANPNPKPPEVAPEPPPGHSTCATSARRAEQTFETLTPSPRNRSAERAATRKQAIESATCRRTV